MNPLFRLKHQLPHVKGEEVKHPMALNSPDAKLSTKRTGGWKGYFITVDGEEKQITKHKYFTHHKNVQRLLEISKTGNATNDDKDLINYYKKLSTSNIEYKVPGINADNINLEPNFEKPEAEGEPKEPEVKVEPKELEVHNSPVQMNIGKVPIEEPAKESEPTKEPEQSSENDDPEGQ